MDYYLLEKSTWKYVMEII